jgi:hypothetical protein
VCAMERTEVDASELQRNMDHLSVVCQISSQ